jgi:Protein of unknown function (DUF3485)
MNQQKWMIVILALGLMGGAAVLLSRLHGTQKLGQPGVKTRPIPGSQRLQVELPERVLDYTSEEIEVDKTTLGWLPQDTSFGQRVYRAADGFETSVSVVLMGRDRTSLHQTEFCLQGAGWVIDRSASTKTSVRMDRPYPYDLPVTQFIASKQVTVNGQSVPIRGIYVLWFVADNDEYTARHWQRMWWMARDLLRTGVLQRWASIGYFAHCRPGQEGATFERLKKFIVASAPEFQLVPRPAGAVPASAP